MTQAIIIFKGNPSRAMLSPENKIIVSPCVWLPHHGMKTLEYIRETADLMAERRHDPQMGCARFIGICHLHDINPLNLSVWNTPPIVENSIRALDDGDLGILAARTATAVLEQYSPGDAGLIVVDVADYTYKCYESFFNEGENGA